MAFVPVVLTELLLVEPEGRNVKCTRIGGTTDISAGQLIDRTGQLLELPFPSGEHLDSLQPGSDGEGCVPRQVQEQRIFPFRRAE